MKSDGFSSEFSKATSWNLTADLGGVGAKGQGLTLAARDGAQVVSSIRVGIGATQDQVFFAPSFTGWPGGSAYRVNVYQNGRLVLGQHYQMDYGRGLVVQPPHRPHAHRYRLQNHTSIARWTPSPRAPASGPSGGARGRSPSTRTARISGDYIEFIEEHR